MTEPDICEHYDGGDAPIFIFADHASAALPVSCGDLGLSPDMLNTHIASDIGAGPLAKALATRLEAKALLCGFSRLFIDPNRSQDRADLIPETSDLVPIPGNHELAAGERHRRIQHYYQPYHEELELAISNVSSSDPDPLIISVHSFTPRLMGDAQIRPWHVGLLWKDDEATARKFMHLLNENTDYTVGDNQPYDARGFNYSVDCHVGPRGLRHLTLEIRQDLISNEVGVDDVADRLSVAIGKL